MTRLRPLALSALTLALVLLAGASNARAESGSIVTWEKVYKVQVEYWFWDSDSYHWEDFYISTNQSAANFVYAVLELAKDNGTLNQAAPNVNWKYFAVDVRLVVAWQAKIQPRFLDDSVQDAVHPVSPLTATRTTQD